ncbi:glucuronyl esterase domain-containing protein [Melioribacter sp. Ez-97]|uniref:glucuronyl esterase domain-containing protein n=1 Tax=Melioribacter sp. Ez-97 TaxID=3423434 RepID=UPI003ED9D128
MKTNSSVIFLMAFFFLFINAYSQEMPRVYDVENTGADCAKPPLPDFSQLPVINELPDPFEWSDGRCRITSKLEWRCRRAEIGEEIQHYELGAKPPKPENMKVTYTDTLMTIVIVENNDTLVINAPISLPEGEGPFPAVIGVGFTPTGSLPPDLFTSRGIATIHFMEWQLTNGWSGSRGDGQFYKLYPDKKRGKFIAWAWGVSRIIDALEMSPESKIDLKHLAVTGCSYAGKIALFSGALDERIALTIAQEPGGGGDAAWRVTEKLPGSRERLRNAQGYAWYHQDLGRFNSAVTKLPYDHHELMAMIAPRALLVLGNPDYEWLAEESGHVACKAAHEVWKALGVPDRFGFSKVAGHQHCQLPDIQRPEVTAFIEKFLLDIDTVNTNIEISPYDSDLSSWITWTTPELSDTLTSVGKNDIIENEFELIRNFPNPFNPVTKIVYKIPENGFVSLKVYNSLGQEVKTLFEGYRQKGKYEILFDAADLTTGLYLCRLSSMNFEKTTKLLLLK